MPTLIKAKNNSNTWSTVTKRTLQKQLWFQSTLFILFQVTYTTINMKINTCINSSPREQNGHHFPDDIFRCTTVNEKFYILIKILLKFVLKSPFDSNPALVEIMAWYQTGHKALSEPMLIQFTDAYMRH